jgi:hypothetical protein
MKKATGEEAGVKDVGVAMVVMGSSFFWYF